MSTPSSSAQLRNAIGILHETKNRFERRVPLIPPQVAELVADGIEVRVQRSPTRAFRDEEFAAAGAVLVDDVTDCRLLMGVKEVKPAQVRPGQTVMCFSHTIKGQAHNMPLLQHFLDQGASLVDYEVIVDEKNVRQVAFGRYAGIAGAHETLWTLAHRVKALGRETPLAAIKHAVDYPDLAAMVADTRAALERLAAQGGDDALSPFVVGVTGMGRVSKGALEYLEMVGAKPISIAEAVALGRDLRAAGGRALRVLALSDGEIYQRAGQTAFDFNDYLAHPELYVCTGAMYLPYMRALVNGAYWDARFPRLLDDSTLHRMFANHTLPPVLGDVACDIDGGIEWTVRATENDEPAFIYDPRDGKVTVGVDGYGVAIMSVDNLPCALPRDASVDFSRALIPFVRPFFNARFAEGGLDALPPALQTAVVVAAGRLAPRHAGLAKHLPGASASKP